MIDRRDEYLAVADLAGARARRDDLDGFVGKVGPDGDFDPQLRQKVHDVFGAAVDLGVALLTAVALDLGYGHAVNADRGQRLAHLVQLERFDNRNHELHGSAFTSLESASAAPLGARRLWHLFVQMTQKLATRNEIPTAAVVTDRGTWVAGRQDAPGMPREGQAL